MPKKKSRKRPDVLDSKRLADGSVEENRKTWEQAYGHMPESMQWLIEHTRIHNDILIKESDRAAAVLAPAYLDALLDDLLREFLRETKAVDNLLSPSRPLGTYSARIDLVHALGFVSDETQRDLHLIRKIRNEFAHNVDTNNFDEEVLEKRCRELSVVTDYEKGSFNFNLAGITRTVFLLAISKCVNEISSGMRYVRRRIVVPPMNKPDDNWKGF
jgi:DNA-binding MltR family transcriptional regulator